MFKSGHAEYENDTRITNAQFSPSVSIILIDTLHIHIAHYAYTLHLAHTFSHLVNLPLDSNSFCEGIEIKQSSG